ncbi:pickpocket protein 28 [Anabrus simplex]|uniref:pickpocket protein 28 n=1 Tax=Anabrus simplex TaxID=316456 RepID=UPI0034DD35D9
MWNAVKVHVQDYCSSTSIHGLQYIGAPNRPLLERLWWLIVTCLSFAAIVMLIKEAWVNWQTTPVIVSFEESMRPIWEFPFPAVTVCPVTKFRASLHDYQEMIRRKKAGNLSEMELQLLDDRSQLCPRHYEAGKNNFTATLVDTIEKLAPTLVQTINYALYNNDPKWGRKGYFQPLMTDDGLCFSFNMLPASALFTNNTFHASRSYLDYDMPPDKWTPDGGYTDLEDFKSGYPYRGIGAGPMPGLQVGLSANATDMDYDCKELYQGFTMHLHSPAEFPRMKEQYQLIPLQKNVLLTVKPNLMTTSPTLEKYQPQYRQCYFANERKLRFFKVYTQQNCAQECEANYTVQECGCAEFFMPRALDTPVCGPKRAECLYFAKRSLLRASIVKGLRSANSAPMCSCLQSCNHIQYSTERSETGVEDHEEKTFKYSIVNIFFKDTQFTASRRSELYGTAEFLANCGGLLGLGLGFSVLSLAEIFYWVFLRAFCSKPQVVNPDVQPPSEAIHNTVQRKPKIYSFSTPHSMMKNNGNNGS